MKSVLNPAAIIMIIIGMYLPLVSQSKKTVQCTHQSKNMHYSSFERCIQNITSIIPDYIFSTQSSTSLIQIMPSIKTSGLKTIEGMEVEKIGKGNINFRIINEIIGMDTTIRFQYHIKAGTESLGIETEILEKFEKDPTVRDQLQKVIAKSIAGNQQCKKDAIDHLITEEKLKEALSLSVRYKKYTPECAAVLQPVINDLTKKLDSVACQKTLYEAEILINSGIEFKINKAVDMLLQISPSASCVKESLALSEKISNQRSLSAQAKAKMERYKIIIAEKKYNDWYELMEY